MMFSSQAVLLMSFTLATAAKEPDLPLCPTNIQYFPQNLPMHCRMPKPGELPPMPPGMPSMNMPPFPPSMPMNMPGVSMPLPFPGGPMMPMAMPGSPPGAKLPVIVMPFYKQEKGYGKEEEKEDRPRWKTDSSSESDWVKKRKHKKWHTDSSEYESSSDTDTDSDSDGYALWGGRRAGGKKRHHRHHKSHKSKRRPLYTPVLQYVTKDGYVIYEKTITTNEAEDWLNVDSKNKDRQSNDREHASVINDGDDDETRARVEVRRKPKSQVEMVEPVTIHRRKNSARASQSKAKMQTGKNSKS